MQITFSRDVRIVTAEDLVLQTVEVEPCSERTITILIDEDEDTTSCYSMLAEFFHTASRIE